MSQPRFITTEEDLRSLHDLVLVIDKRGVLGNELALALREYASVVLVSGEPIWSRTRQEKIDRIAYVPFFKSIPVIPENVYSYIFVVYSAETREFLHQIIIKAEKDGAVCAVAIPLRLYDQSLVDSILSSYKNCRAIVFGDIFASKMVLDKDATVNAYMSQAQESGIIRVVNMGTRATFPVRLDDVVEALIQIAFREHMSLRVFFAFPKHPPTELSLAHMIQKANPLIRVDFVKKDEDKQLDIKIGEGDYIFGDTYPITQKIAQEVFSQPRGQDRPSDIKKESDINIREDHEEEKEQKYPIRAILFSLVLFLAWMVLLPIAATLFFSFIGARSLSLSRSSLERGDVNASYAYAKSSKTFFETAEKSSQSILFSPLIITKLISDIQIGRDLAVLVSDSARAVLIIKTIFSSTSKDPENDISLATSDFIQAFSFFEKLQSEGMFRDFSPDRLRDASRLIATIPSILPSIVYGENKTFMVLFQNNMELRPGGGFIGSYGLLTLNKGGVKDFVIHDVYDADGQLKGHVEPPYPIRRHIPILHWYLRDSNFDVDFRNVASQAAFFLNQETGIAVDGVVAIDVSFVKEIVAALGSLYVPDYNETITGENFYTLTQSHAEKNFSPGSTQKKDFLRSLYNAARLKLLDEKGSSFGQLAVSVLRAIDTKHILVAYNQENIQAVLTASGLSSGLWDQRVQDSLAINDFLGISEANLGINKANYFVRKKIIHEATIVSGEDVAEKLEIKYKNESNSWPGGDYKNYLRLILPLRTELTSIIIDGKEQEIIPAVTDPQVYEGKKFKPPGGLEVEKNTQEGRTIFGFLVTIPQGSIKTVTVLYALAQKISEEANHFSYDMYFFKQPGTIDDPFSFSLSFPSDYQMLKSSSGLDIKGDRARISTFFDTDKRYEASFSKK